MKWLEKWLDFAENGGFWGALAGLAIYPVLVLLPTSGLVYLFLSRSVREILAAACLIICGLIIQCGRLSAAAKKLSVRLDQIERVSSS